MARLLLAVLLCLTPAARADWSAFRAGPLEVITDGGDRQARDVLATFDQLRHITAKLMGRQELNPLWPVRVVLVKRERDNARYQTPALALRRDAYMGGMFSGETVPREWFREFARILLGDDTGPLPAAIEDGFVEVLASAEVDATRITLGAPPEAARRTRDWARMHLLAVTPDYSGRVRVFFSNLEQGAPIDVAYRNTFERTQQQMEAEVERYLAAGSFQAEQFSGQPLNPERDYRERPVAEERARIALADLLGGEAARAACLALLNAESTNPDAYDCAGMYEEATSKGSENARAWMAYGRSLKEPAKAWDAFQRAAQLNARWEEPQTALADLSKDPARKVAFLKKAVELAPRRTALWEKLAETQLEAKDYAGAAESWRHGARTARSEEERARLEGRRREFEQQRLDLEAAERRRQEEERQRELEELKEKALARIREAELRANAAAGPADPNRKVVEWWEGPGGPSQAAQGTLERVDCLRRQLRLAIRGADGKLAQYLIADPSKIVLAGGGEQALGCGPVRPARRIKIDYTPKQDPKLGTIGEVTLIDFQQ